MVSLYRDRYLSILKEKKDRAQASYTAAFAQYTEAYRTKEHLQARLQSRKRIAKSLDRASEPSQIAELQVLLKEFPPEDELRNEVQKAVDETERTSAVLRLSRAAHKKAVTDVNDRRTFTLWVNQRYSKTLSEIFRKFGNIELTCKYDKARDRLDVYFGGRHEPDGDGHAHWVIDKRGEIVYRRNPKK